MSSAVKQKTLSTAQRAAQAINQAIEALGLDDAKRLSAALTIAASEGVRKNPMFAAHVRSLYEDMAPKRSTARPTASNGRADDDLVPVKQVDYIRNPAAPPDPYFLLELYGAHQLRLALQRYTLARLKEAIPAVQAQHPDTKPKGKATKDSVIDYIVEHVAGPGN